MVRSEWHGRFAAIAVLVSFTLAACQTSAPTAGQAPAPAESPPPQQLTVAVAGLLSNLDAHATAGPYNGLKFAMFDTVTRTDAKGNVGPWLATSWRTLEPTTWEFKLRENVRFSNGEPMDAAAVKFSIERIINPANKLALASRIPLVTGAEVSDPLTVRITTRQPDAILPARMAAIYVVPPGEVTRLGPDQFGLKPVGTGPFRITEFVADTRVVFEKFPESWRTAKLDKLTFLSLPETSTRVAALRNGDVQLIYSPPLDQLDGIQQGGLVIASTTFARLLVYSLDQITEDTPLRDKRVRQAINYAVDKAAILKNVFAGHGRVADGQLVGPAGFGYDPSLKPYPYDPAMAKRLLAEAGYANGFTIRMESAAGDAVSQQQNLAVQGYLRDVGIDAKLEVYEQAVWLDHFYGRQKRAPILSWAPNYFPAMDIDFPLQYMVSSSLHKVYSNPELDRLYAASTTELDPQKRYAILKQMSALIHEEVPVLFLIEPEEIWADAKSVQGFLARSDGEPSFEDVSLTR
jgi:peptide/nickel transport system substrate-binding protein